LSALSAAGIAALVDRSANLDEAEAIIRQAEASARKAKLDYQQEPEPAPEAPVGAPAPAQVTRQPRSRWSELLSPRCRVRTLIAWVLWASAFFVANSLNNWMPTLYHT
ncbi:hypothetical protein AB9F37_33030, partial [Rhizobium leguminosarum]